MSRALPPPHDPPLTGRHPAPMWWLAVLVAAALCGLRQIMDWDFYWHLAVGREALHQRSLLPADIFSYAAHGARWPYKDLLADVLLYAGFATIGAAWLAVLKGGAALCCAAAWWLAPGPTSAARASALLWFPLSILYLLAVVYRLNERPLLFSLALFPLLLAGFERVRRALHPDAPPPELRRALAVTCCLLWLWALLHREALVGLVLLVGLAGYGTLSWLLERRAPRLAALLAPVRPGAVPTLWGGAACALGLCTLNPSGWHLYTTSVDVVRSAMLRRYIIEWHPMTMSQLWSVLPWAMSLTLAALVLCAVTLARAWRDHRRGPLDLWHLGLLSIFIWQTLSSPRWVPMMAASAALCLSLGCSALARRLAAPADGGTTGLSLPRGLGALCAVGGIALLWACHPYPLGLGPRPNQYPEGALRFALAHLLHQKAANTLPYGGYLIWRGWPRFLVEVDGRNDTVYDPAYIISCFDAEHDAAAFAQKRRADGADWVLAATGPLVQSHPFLLSDPAWALVYYSHAGAIFVRRDAYPELAGLALRYVPLLVAKQSAAPSEAERRSSAARSGAERRSMADVLLAARSTPGGQAALLAELQRVAADTPEDSRLLVWLVTLYDELGPAYAAQQEGILRELLRRRPDLAVEITHGQ